MNAIQSLIHLLNWYHKSPSHAHDCISWVYKAMFLILLLYMDQYTYGGWTTSCTHSDRLGNGDACMHTQTLSEAGNKIVQNKPRLQ